MMPDSAPAQRRVFYIIRRGGTYELVRVWEKGAVVTPADLQAAVRHVFATDPDERIIAEQTLAVHPAGLGRPPVIEGDPAAVA